MSNRKYSANRISEDHKAQMKKYIEANPEATYTQFQKDLGSKIKCSDAHYYTIKRSVFGPSRPAPRAYNRNPDAIPRKTATLYLTLWSYPAEKVSPETKEVLQDFINTINGVRKSRFTLIEMKDPAVVEIRETHSRV